MLASSRTPQRWRRSRTAALVAGIASGALLLALAGCTGESAPEQPSAEPTIESTPLADYDTSDLTLVPGEFCDRVSEQAITAALGSDLSDGQTWQPGTRLPESRDISNEFGCSWADGSIAARAWVFAPPITAQRAADFVKETGGKKCERIATAPDLGEPSVAQHCKGAGLTGIYGLVGGAWVGCEISGLPESGGATDTGDTARVGEWCVGVLEAMRGA